MLPKQKSLRLNFLIKLTAATAVLEFFFSILFYSYIQYSVDNELKGFLVKQARYLFATYANVEKALIDKRDILKKTLKVHAQIASLPNEDFRAVHFRPFTQKGHRYLSAYFPYDFASQSYLVLTADVSKQKQVQNKVTRGIIAMNVFGMIGILVYAFFLSGMLIAPIRVFSRKIASMNESMLSPLDLKNVPEEFLPLGKSVNHLVGRIETFLTYKKELFVGTAHELKTPLAVMKTKSQVALLKRNVRTEDLIEALRQNIRSVDDMNHIVGSILAFGRAEGAQFEKPETIDVDAFLRTMCDEFSLLTAQEKKKLSCHLHSQVSCTLPPLLLHQIIQNLLQNAIKFTPQGKKVVMSSYTHKGTLYIRVRDEGRGIEEGVDLFAPFKRSADSTGAGLGLFLVKSAAEALQAEIRINNRREGRGAVAIFSLPLKEITPPRQYQQAPLNKA